MFSAITDFEYFHSLTKEMQTFVTVFNGNGLQLLCPQNNLIQSHSFCKQAYGVIYLACKVEHSVHCIFTLFAFLVCTANY